MRDDLTTATLDRDPSDDPRTIEDHLMVEIMMASGTARECDPSARIVLEALLEHMEAGTTGELAMLIEMNRRPLAAG